MIAVVLGVIASYLVGSIPFGYLAGKTLKGIDITKYGSGNVGATNVLRTLGTAPGIAVLLLDVGKGVFSILVVASLIHPLSASLDVSTLRAVCGAAAITGHDWPVFLRFRGGKGVSTGLGVFLSLTPLYALASLIPFLGAVILTKRVSVGSLVLAASLPIIMLVAGKPMAYSALGLFWLISVLYLHRENITRLLHGGESRIGHKTQVSSEDQ